MPNSTTQLHKSTTIRVRRNINIWGIAALTRLLGREEHLAQNIRNGIKDCGARKIDQQILYLRGERKWVNC
jgi:hypothetical protein